MSFIPHITCPKCGTAYIQGSKFCAKCGTQLAAGPTKPLNPYSVQRCGFCGGRGRSFMDICPACRGAGSVTVTNPARKCESCGGSGKRGTTPCPTCGGCGWSGRTR